MSHPDDVRNVDRELQELYKLGKTKGQAEQLANIHADAKWPCRSYVTNVEKWTCSCPTFVISHFVTIHMDSFLSSHTYSTLTHISHAYDSSLTHLLHCSHTYSTLTHISHAYDSSLSHLLHHDSSAPIALLLYIQLDIPLVTLAWSYSNIPEF